MIAQYVIGLTSLGQYDYVLINAQGEVLAQGPALPSKQACVASINRLRQYAQLTQHTRRRVLPDGGHSFSLHAPDGALLAYGTGLPSVAQREVAIDAIRAIASKAVITATV